MKNRFLNENVKLFINECQKLTDDTYEPFYEENCPTVYLTQEGKLIGFASIFEYLDTSEMPVWEISILVHPSFRRNGMGKKLVNQLLTENDGETFLKNHGEIYLTGNNESFASSCDFSFSHSEHFMKCSNKGTTFSLPEGIQILPSLKKGNFRSYRLFVQNSSAARCRIYQCSDYINIWNMYTNKACRGNGYAGLLLEYIKSEFPDKYLLLQVSGSNSAAIRAYKKSGFEIIHSTCFYKRFPTT